MADWNAILGINARNAHIDEVNPRSAIRLVNNKQATKHALLRVGNPIVPTLHFILDHFTLRHFNLDKLPDSWVIKPNQSLQGKGVMLVIKRSQNGWLTPSGREVTKDEVYEHIREILDGEHSPRGDDTALVEPLLRPHFVLKGMAPAGLPDIRVICNGDRPDLAMARLPTMATGGRANLHQGGIGAAINLKTGIITDAYHNETQISTHPDTGTPLIGVRIPFWGEILDMSTRCAEATGLKYLGVDIVVDESFGPIILEVNARPGLEIQNVSRSGLYRMVFSR